MCLGMGIGYFNWHDSDISKDFTNQTLYALKYGYSRTELPYFSFVARIEDDVIILHDSITDPKYLASQIPQKRKDFGFEFSHIDLERVASEIPEFGRFDSWGMVRFAEMNPKEKKIFTKTLMRLRD